MASSSSRSSSNSVNREQDAPTAAAAASKTSISRRKNRVSEAFEVAAEEALASRFLVLQKLGPTTFLIQQDHEVQADEAGDICTEAGEVVFQSAAASSASGTGSGESGSASSSYDPRDHAKPHPDAAKAISGGGGAAAATKQKFKVSLGVPRHTCSCGGGTSKFKCATSSSDRTTWCVHICFVLLKVLRVGRDFATVSQDRITEAELEQLLSYQERQKQKRFVEQQKQQRREEMMSKFRANLENAGVDLAAGSGSGGGSSFAFKPPDADDQCPICFDDLLDDKTDKNSLSLVYCADGCRQAIHTACMYKWCEHHGRSGSSDNTTGATCPLCRVSWSKEQIALLGKRYQRSIRKRKEAHAGFGCVFCKTKPIRGALFAALGAGGPSGGGGGSGVSSAGSGFAGGRALLRQAGLGIVQGTGHATLSAISAHQPASDEASNMIATYCEDCFYNPVARAATSGKPFVKKAQADSSDLELVCLPVSTTPQLRQPQPVTVGGQNVHPPGSQHMAGQNASLVLLQEVVAANPELQSMDDVPLSVMLALGHEVAQRRQTRGSGVPPLQWQQVGGADSSTSFVSTTSTSTRTSSSSLSLPRTQTTVAPEPIVTTMDGAILHALAIEARDAQTTQRKSGTRIEVTGSRKKECVFCTSSSSTNAEPADVLLPRCGHWAHRSCVSGAYKCPACDTFLLRSLDALLRKKVKPDEQALAKGGGGSADLGAALLLPGSSDALCLQGSGVSLGGPTSTSVGTTTQEEQGDDSTSRTRIIPNRTGRRCGVNAGGTRAAGPALAAPSGAAANFEVGNSAGTTAATEFASGEEFSLEGASMRLRCDSHTAAAPPAASNTALQTSSSRSAGGGRSQKLASSGQLPRRGRRDSEGGMPADREIELDGTVITYASASGGVEKLQEPSAISLIKPKPNTGRARDRRPLAKTSPAHAEDRAQQGAQRDKSVMPAGDRAGESYEPVGDFALSGQTLKTGLQTPAAAVADTQKTTSTSKKTSSDIEQVSRRRKMSTGGRLLLGKASGGSARASDVAVFESADLLSLQGDAKALANATSMNRRSTRN